MLRVAACLLLLLCAARAEPATRIIVPFAPGGGFDAVARAFAETVRETIGPVVVENRGGGGGQIALDDFARAEPDGRTLLLGNNILHPRYPFTAVGVLGSTPTVIVVRGDLPVRSLADLVAYVKERPGKLSYGSPGAGTLPHIAGELFRTGAGLDLVHVPYKGTGPALADLIGGHIAVMTQGATSNLIDMHRAGIIKILAVNALARSVVLPDVPTAAEQGLPQLVCVARLGVIAPLKTPPAVLGKLRAAAAATDVTGFGYEPDAGNLIDEGNCGFHDNR